MEFATRRSRLSARKPADRILKEITMNFEDTIRVARDVDPQKCAMCGSGDIPENGVHRGRFECGNTRALNDYERGQLAFARGYGRVENPYMRNQQEHWNWEAGWICADREMTPEEGFAWKRIHALKP